MNQTKTGQRDREYLLATLRRIDGRGYKAYKDIEGVYRFPDGITLLIDHVQGDPFAAPSRCRVRVDPATAGFSSGHYSNRSREHAARDYLTRQFAARARAHRPDRGSGGSGAIEMAHPGQCVLERSAVQLGDAGVEARFTVGLPAQGRRVLGRQAAELLGDAVPGLVADALLYKSLDAAAFRAHLEACEDADWLRGQLRARGLVAFVADGAVLPRRSGVDDRPMEQGAVPFAAPETLRVSFERPNNGTIEGMGLPQGVNLISGGGFHGKSTLLRALEEGVYNHVPGDGREWVVADPAAVKIRAEDGRSVVGVNLSPFINDLPGGHSTENFSTPNASGSTSQAANILEMMEAGAKVLLIDEDTSATNFMIRDRRMQALVAREREPITPFIDKARQLYEEWAISTVLVTGGSGDYLDVADTVLTMEEYRPFERTRKAREIAARFTTGRETQGGGSFGRVSRRRPSANFLPQGKRGGTPRVRVRAVEEIRLEKEAIDLTGVEQLVETGQLEGIGAALCYAGTKLCTGREEMGELLDKIEELIETQGLDAIASFPGGRISGFRRFELAATWNRLRTLRHE